MSAHFDFSRYLSLPVLDPAGTVALANALVAAATAERVVAVEHAYAKMKAELARLEAAWQPIAKEKPPSDRRPADRAVDNGWSALFDRLQGCAKLPAHRYPKAADAAKLMAKLYPTGLTFLSLAFDQEWAESRRRLELVDSEQLQASLDDVAGPEYLAEVRLTHEAYGVALGITVPREVEPPPKNLAEPLKATQDAMRSYLFKVLGAVVDDDPESVAAARGALKPVDDLRDA